MTDRSFCDDKERLVAYLYDDGDAEARASVDDHLATCVACREELGGLRSARVHLTAWAPAEPELGFRIVREPARRARFAPLPAWGLAAAAVLVLSVGAAIANVEVRVGRDGVTLRTGRTPAATSGAAPGATTVPAVSAADLRALEQRLAAQIAARTRPAGDVGAQPVSLGHNDADLSRRLRTLVDESEKRQERELAIRIQQLVRDFDRQREADFVRIRQNVGQWQNLTGAEFARQRQELDYLIRASTTTR